MTEQDSLKIVRLGQLKTFKDNLANVAISGNASDVALTAIDGLTSTQVQAAIAELKGMIVSYADKVVSGGYSVVVESGNIVKRNGTTVTPAAAPSGISNGTYLVLTIENDSENPVYVPATALVDIYTAAQNATQVQVSIDSATNVVSASIVAGSISSTELNSTVNDNIDKGVTAYGWGNHANAGYATKVSNPTAGNFVALDSNGNIVDSTVKAADFKTTQTAVADPTATGDAVSFIDTIAQNANGEITVTKKNVTNASAAAAGLMSAAHYSKLEEISYATDSDVNGLFE